METSASQEGPSRGRVPAWLPYVAIWAPWALFQLMWGIPDLVAAPKSGWSYAIPMLLFPFNAGFYGAWVLVVPLATPFVFVWLDRLARPGWNWRSAVARYAVVAMWFGMSFMLAPISGIGAVWTGGFDAAELAQMFIDGWAWGFATLLAAAAIISGARRVLRSITGGLRRT